MLNCNFYWQKFCLDKIDPSWKFFFEQEVKSYLFSFLKQIYQEYKNYVCYPEIERVFFLFKEVSLEKIKVVILGQDPYYVSGVADGLAFSTQKKNYIPASLKNIFLELVDDVGCSFPTEGNLLSWAKKGVFLLNTSLTVIEGKPLSHTKIWEPFICSLIIYLKKENKKLVWVFWGNNSKRIKTACGIATEDSVVSSHPSPFSAKFGFFSSRPFSRINKMLVDRGVLPIEWCLCSSLEKKDY